MRKQQQPRTKARDNMYIKTEGALELGGVYGIAFIDALVSNAPRRPALLGTTQQQLSSELADEILNLVPATPGHTNCFY